MLDRDLAQGEAADDAAVGIACDEPAALEVHDAAKFSPTLMSTGTVVASGGVFMLPILRNEEGRRPWWDGARLQTSGGAMDGQHVEMLAGAFRRLSRATYARERVRCLQ